MSLFKGLGVAMITPFDKNGVNFDAAGKIIEHIIGGGASSLIVLGTTGEPSTMSQTECDDMIRFTIEKTAKRVPVIVGAGTNSTEKTIQSSLNAERLGADGLLIVTPYYNKCTQNGLVAHYKAVAESVKTPIITYSVPGRTGVNILPETALRLSDIKNIVAIKEASGNIDQVQEIIRLTKGKTDVYLGDDNLTYTGMALGAKGVISVVGNVIPDKMSTLTSLMLNGEYDKARELNFKLCPIYKALFVEVNPIPVKWAMNYIGLNAGVPRLPLTPLDEKFEGTLKNVLNDVLK